MTVLLPMLMAYSLIGEKFHEIIGTLMFSLFILHHVLNRKWYGATFRGKLHARRIFQTALDVLLIVFMLAQPISGILMSKHLYTFIQIPGISATVREQDRFLLGFCCRNSNYYLWNLRFYKAAVPGLYVSQDSICFLRLQRAENSLFPRLSRDYAAVYVDRVSVDCGTCLSG